MKRLKSIFFVGFDYFKLLFLLNGKPLIKIKEMLFGHFLRAMKFEKRQILSFLQFKMPNWQHCLNV